ncbi:hypothetical protein [Microbacterium laevaniformans]|uniref:hypothetical protein n=1 Tax=Microbacterium laevaniformans TaxID=36807 RepID=UPI003D952853
MRRFVSLVALAVLIGWLLFAWSAGWRLILVDGGSMVPTIADGELLLNRPASGHELVEGAIVTIGEPPASYRTHRVVEVHDDSTATLQGDANTTPDPGRVTEANVVSVPIWHGPPWWVAGALLGAASIWILWPASGGQKASRVNSSRALSDIPVRRRAARPAAERNRGPLQLATDVADSTEPTQTASPAVHVVGS